MKSGGSPEPLSVSDFLKYLEVKKVFRKMPNAFRVAHIVEQIESSGLLIHAGSTPSFGGLGNCYLYVALESDARRHLFRFVPVLGPEFLYNLCKPGLAHITGTNDNGDAVAGTGFVGHASYIITCRHVVNDMTINEKQIFQGREYSVDRKSIYAHSDVDVAVIHVDGPALQPVQGTAFQAPVVAQTVYTLGYPKLPGLRDASVTMQQGAVTNESVTALSGESLFSVFRDLQTRKQRWPCHVSRRLCGWPLCRGCQRSVPSGRGVLSSLCRNPCPGRRQGC